MKFRFPLYAKILLWFFLNLVALGIGFYAFFQAQVRIGLNSLMMGRAGDRIQAVSEVIAGELNKTTGRAAWSDILRKFGDSYQVRFYLFHSDGWQIAGDPVTLPPQVANVLTERRAAPRQPPDNQGNRQRQPPDSQPDRPRSGPSSDRPYQKFMERVADPLSYWVGVRLPVLDREKERFVPATLLAASDSMTGGGLFLDFRPWMLIGLGALVFSVLFWIPLVRSITHSISQMTQATAQIAAGRFDVQVAAQRSDELGYLGESINRMAARLAGFVSGQRRFLGDIAHELCSPIARIQLSLGILEQRADEKQKASVEDLREEVQQMTELVNELLSFSKAGMNPKDVRLDFVLLRNLAERVVAREAANAPIEMEIDRSHLVLAAPDLLERALGNVIRNAVRYAGQSGKIRISSENTPEHVLLMVTDSGPGLPEEVLDRIMDPFFRPEPSRSRESGGVGLGLAIVKTCVEACQGTVSVRNIQPSGLQIEFRLRPGTSSPAP
jgi:two-component system, OmpR family, sensor histidine kinase CpxA